MATQATSTSTVSEAARRFAELERTIAALRAPDGCPGDREQSHASIAHNMVEEAYEAMDAIDQRDAANLREELGDVLLQVVLQSQMATEAGEFTLADVVGDINAKMVRRHPHVFGDEAAFAAAGLTPEQVAQIRATQTSGEVLDLWDQIKIYEKKQKAARHGAHADNTAAPAPAGLLDGVPTGQPACMQAQGISRKAAAAGFEWRSTQAVWAQVLSEVEEFKAATPGTAEAAGELGDVLFSVVNVARKEGIDAESALRETCAKFRRRWSMMEAYARAAGGAIDDFSTEQQEAWWQRAKQAEAGQPQGEERDQ
jgi:tetrapyrrole methylase family protein/MazG family protein